MQKISVIGSGTMGLGIAQVAANADCTVVIIDNNASALLKAKQTLETTLLKLVEKNKINEQKKNEILQAITFSENIESTKDSEMVIEAIVENFEVKKNLFLQLESFVSSSCIIASNTSSISITALAGIMKHPQRFIGIHFFNPAIIMPLVEIIPGFITDANTIAKSVDTIAKWGKTTVVCKDSPGFIVNKIARPYYGESIRIYEEGIANIETIDFALKTLGGFKMGPFELMDMIGNDVNYAVTKTVWEQFFFDAKYKPSFTQQRLVQSNLLGKKTGKGYYNYTEPTPLNISEDLNLHTTIFNRVIAMLVNEAYDTLYMQIANEKDIETAMTRGVNYPKGLIQWGLELGLKNILNTLDDLYNQYHEERYRASVLLRRKANEV